MSLKKLIRIVATCDGPCGSVLEVQDIKLPEGWTLLKVENPYPDKGENPTKLTSGLCPKCSERFYQLLRHEGYSFLNREEVLNGGKGAGVIPS